MNKTIIIVGAGAAGLMAARTLAKHRYNVLILESRPETGGRIRSHQTAEGHGVIEAGAEFVHGKLPVTLTLCKEAGITYLPIDGAMYRKEKNRWIEEEEMIEGWDTLMKKMKAVKEDMTLTEFLGRYYPDDTFSDFKRQVTGYVQGFDLADPAKVSVKGLYDEWSHEDEHNFRIPEGYGKLISFLEKECLSAGCKIIKGDAVKQIDWQRDDITVYTASGRKHQGNKVLVTIPVGVLTDLAGSSSLNFTPPVDEYIRAAGNIGYGSVIRAVMDFKRPFWKPDTAFVISDQVFPTWWTQRPLTNHLLSGWAGGARAANLYTHTNEELLEIAFMSLSNIFAISVADLKGNAKQSVVYNWHTDENVLGAYSYPTPKTTSAKKLLNTPLDNTVFFGGEAVYEGQHPGTVEAALVSGSEAARSISESDQ